jgi:hypothetical protein
MVWKEEIAMIEEWNFMTFCDLQKHKNKIQKYYFRLRFVRVLPTTTYVLANWNLNFFLFGQIFLFFQHTNKSYQVKHNYTPALHICNS